MRFKSLVWLAILLPLSTLALEIYPQVSGAIIEIKPVKTQVKKGDVIVRL
jgi:hypothetical protein